MKVSLYGLLVSSAFASVLASCAPEPVPDAPGQEAEPVSNKIDVPPEVISNLGITFAEATRGRLGVWRDLPGQLEVPESRRWIMRAPAHSRLQSVVSRWQIVAEGEELARLNSPELRKLQNALEAAEQHIGSAAREVSAAQARLEESEAHVLGAREFEGSSRERLQQIEELGGGLQAVTVGEIISIRKTVSEASKASLDAAIVRDDLITRLARKRLEADQARLSLEENMTALSLLTSRTIEELSSLQDGKPLWRQVDEIRIPAPHAGVVVELFAAQGETLEDGAAIMQVFDTSELRFRGHLPEGDLGLFAEGNRVRLEFPARRLPAVETSLDAPLPVAHADTRMIEVLAQVPNPDGVFAHGISVMAQVQVQEGRSDEVLIPARCVVLDGLETIVFRRDPSDPGKVIRTPVEIGGRGAKLVEVLAGVLDGDQLVADGVYQLKQTGIGRAPQGGHFHADGSFHGDHK